MPRARVSRSRLAPPAAEERGIAPARSPAKKATTRSRALSVEALEQLGVRRLAELLMAQSKGDPALARSLRLVLAGMDGTGRLAAEVEKRLRTIQRSKGFIERAEIVILLGPSGGVSLDVFSRRGWL